MLANTGRWFSNIDIQGTNLKVMKGEPLPELWQGADLVGSIKKMYGEEAVYYKASTTSNNITVGGAMKQLEDRMASIESSIKELRDILLSKQDETVKTKGRTPIAAIEARKRKIAEKKAEGGIE